MKYLFILLVFLCGNVRAQQLGISLSKGYGCFYWDNLNTLLPLNSGYIMAGNALDLTGSAPCSYRPLTYGKTSAWAIKVDDTGRIIWSKIFNPTENQTFLGACAMQNGYIFVGHSRPHEMYAVGLDTAGNKKWERTYGGKAMDEAIDILPTPDGEYLIFGHSQSREFDSIGAKGATDIAVLRINDTGKVIWQKLYGTPGSEMAFNVTPTADSGYVIVGTTTSGSLWQDVLAMKIDAKGTLLWQKTYGGSKADYGRAVTETRSKQLLIAVNSNSTDGDMGPGFGKYDARVIKTDSAGNLIWVKTYGGSENDSLNAVIESSEGGILLAGGTASSDNHITTAKGLGDMWILKTDDDGNVQASKTFGGKHYEWATDMVQLINKSYVIVGNTYSADGDIIRPSGYYDGWLLTLTPFLASDVPTVNLTQATVYPTITQGQVYIRTTAAQRLDIKVYNSMGQYLEVPVATTTGGYMANFDNLPSGMYIILLTNGQHKEYTRVVKQ